MLAIKVDCGVHPVALPMQPDVHDGERGMGRGMAAGTPHAPLSLALPLRAVPFVTKFEISY